VVGEASWKAMDSLWIDHGGIVLGVVGGLDEWVGECRLGVLLGGADVMVTQ
jgi:hypothetical protein